MSALFGDSPYLRQLEALVPAVFSCCRGEDEQRTLGSLSSELAGVVPPPTIQRRDDLIDLATAKTRDLLGRETAELLRQSLEESFTALTANHHAINTLPDFMQGSIVYALRKLSGGRENDGGAVPVFAAGGVPMSDFTYPCGILLARPRRSSSTAGARFMLFKPKARKTLVIRQPGFTAADLALARARASNGNWLWFEEKALITIVDDILSLPSVLGQRLYSHQCTIINATLWPRLFKPEVRVPRLVMLDKLALERDLLLADLTNENSLAHAILFTPELRYAIARNLNGSRACWACENVDLPSAPARGTLFFWGIDREGRMFPLNLDQKRNRLFAASDVSFSLDLTRDAVADSLRENRILPGLFLGFAAMALARGLLCCGGVFQAGYLRRMREMTALSLRESGFSDMAACLEALPDAPFTSGFLPLGFRSGDSPPYAAGGIELFASGGLSVKNLETLQSMSVAQALEPSFNYIYELAVPPGERQPGWLEAVRPDYGVELSPWTPFR